MRLATATSAVAATPAAPIAPPGSVPPVLVKLRALLQTSVPGLAGALEVGVLHTQAGSVEVSHLRKCVPARGRISGAARIPLRALEEQRWCGACMRAMRESLSLYTDQSPQDVSWVLCSLEHVLANVVATEARFAKCGPASVARRGVLLGEHRNQRHRLEYLSRPEYGRSVLGEHFSEITEYVEQTTRRRERNAIAPSARLVSRLRQEAARAQGIIDHRGALEDDEVLIVLRQAPRDALGVQIVSAYGLSNPHGVTVVRGPRFLASLLTSEGSILPQITPAPEAAVAELAAGLFEPDSRALGAIAHCVKAARDILVT